MRVRLSRDAQADLADITDYLIAHASQRLAKRVSKGLRSTTREIGRFPKGNVIVATHLGRPLHRRPFMRWVILYEELGDEVVVIRIADGAQDYLAWFTP